MSMRETNLQFQVWIKTWSFECFMDFLNEVVIRNVAIVRSFPQIQQVLSKLYSTSCVSVSHWSLCSEIIFHQIVCACSSACDWCQLAPTWSTDTWSGHRRLFFWSCCTFIFWMFKFESKFEWPSQLLHYCVPSPSCNWRWYFSQNLPACLHVSFLLHG